MPQYIHADPKQRITLRDMDNMIQSDRPEWVKTLTVFLFYFGARISEALAVTKGDIQIYSDNDGTKLLEVYVSTLKNKNQDKRRLYIPLSSPYVKYLYSYSQRQEDKLWTYTRQWARVQIQKVLGKVCPHTFRHNRLDFFAQRDESDFNLQSWAGWTDTRPAKEYTQAVDVKKMAKRHFQ
jgi:integrase